MIKNSCYSRIVYIWIKAIAMFAGKNGFFSNFFRLSVVFLLILAVFLPISAVYPCFLCNLMKKPPIIAIFC